MVSMGKLSSKTILIYLVLHKTANSRWITTKEKEFDSYSTGITIPVLCDNAQWCIKKFQEEQEVLAAPNPNKFSLTQLVLSIQQKPCLTSWVSSLRGFLA
jgi:hypothetical protein